MNATLDDAPAADQPHGSDDVEEEFRSLMEGLRTTLPGVQLATAFLLTLPLYDKWDTLVRQERAAYYVAFVSALLASLLLMAPSSHQRLRSSDDGVARHHQRHVQVAVNIAILGSALFAVAITAVAFLVCSLVLGTGIAVGYQHGASVDKGARWDPAELGSVVDDLIARAPAPAPVYGT